MSDVDRQIASVAARQHGVLSIRRLRALGLSESQVWRRIGDGRLHQLHRGVYAVGHVRITRRGRLLGAVLALGDRALLSHHDAAALWDLRKPRVGAIHVTAPTRRRRRPGLVPHCSPIHPDDRALVDGIPVTSVPRTLLDLAEVVDARALQRAYEDAARLAAFDRRAVERLLARSNGRRGIGALRTLLDYDPTLATQARSELERMFLDLVRGAGLPMPSVNVLVEGLLVDAYWPPARLVVELDGYAYHSDPEAFERDHARITRLQLAGYEVLPFTYRHVRERQAWVVDAVRSMLERDARRGLPDRRARPSGTRGSRPVI